MTCSFASVYQELGFPPCGGRIHHHHVINKSKLADCKVALRLVETLYQDVLMADVCEVHNVGRWADTKQGRSYLLGRWPRYYVEEALAHVRSCYKDNYPELSYDSLVYNPTVV